MEKLNRLVGLTKAVDPEWMDGWMAGICQRFKSVLSFLVCFFLGKDNKKTHVDVEMG